VTRGRNREQRTTSLLDRRSRRTQGAAVVRVVHEVLQSVRVQPQTSPAVVTPFALDLPGPSRRIRVEPVQPPLEPPRPAPREAPEPQREPEREREPVEAPA
jgi:hypothetical protein